MLMRSLIWAECMTKAEVKQDYAEAFRWFTKAAEQGHADAQYNLGLMYYNDECVKKTLSKPCAVLPKPPNKVMQRFFARRQDHHSKTSLYLPANHFESKKIPQAIHTDGLGDFLNQQQRIKCSGCCGLINIDPHPASPLKKGEEQNPLAANLFSESNRKKVGRKGFKALAH